MVLVLGMNMSIMDLTCPMPSELPVMRILAMFICASFWEFVLR